MATITASSQCPSCGAPLAFDPEKGVLECDYCGSVFTPEQIEEYNAAKQEKAADAFEQTASAPKTAEVQAQEAAAGAPVATADDFDKKPAKKSQVKHSAWDESTIDADWGEDEQDLRTYKCSSCGGEIIATSTTAATQCPYCGNPTVVPGQFSIGKKPNYVIPFKHTQEEAQAALKNHYRSKIFLPKTFTSENQIKKLQGTYVPFWLFNGTCDADCTFHATRSTDHREGDYIVTTTRHYQVQRSGVLPFEKVPADASSRMPDDMMDSIEPFDYSELKPFSMAYLPGFLADRYDVSIQECSPRADTRCENSTLQMLRDDVRGYQSVTLSNKHVNINRGAVDYALLPVWVIKTQWGNNTYLFAMNGQTGKLVGDLPVSKGRFWAFCLGLTVIIGVVLYLLGVGGALADAVWAIMQDM